MSNSPATPRITAIGAGSDAFGLNTLAALLRQPELHGSHLALVDNNPEALQAVLLLAERLNREWQAGFDLSAHTQHSSALPGADFVICSIEAPPREALWRSDYEIPLQFGVRQPYAENGGPGGFAHAARNIAPVLQIAADMQRLCPQAWLINFTNPMQRICDAVSRYSRIRVVGLCHQIKAGYAMLGKVLAEELGISVPPGFSNTHSSLATNAPRQETALQTLQKIEITGAGLNHFTWMLDVHHKDTGRDLYPLFRQRWVDFDPTFEPLTRRMFELAGIFPLSGDEHLCEYLPWLSDPLTQPWQKYDISLYEWDERAAKRQETRQAVLRLASGQDDLSPLLQAESEGTAEVITALGSGQSQTALAVNLPNQGQIPNLPLGAIVETPAVLSGAGVLPVGVPPLPELVAELCRREIAVARLGVDAAVHGDRLAALQCLLLSPGISDIDTAHQVLDAYLEAYRPYLPQFWG